MKIQRLWIALSAALLVLPSLAEAVPIVYSSGGDSTPASIVAIRDAFRSALGGGTVAGVNGSFGGLRREINWDGVPDGFSAPNNLPANFFNANSPRGVVFATPGTGFQVSANAGGIAPIEFGNIDPSYASTFGVFSPQRLFTALGSNIVDIFFFLPGTTTPGLVSGFGSVFTDVDLGNSTTIQFFDDLNASLGIFSVAPGIGASESLSFLGVLFDQGPVISRVRITSGNAALGAGIVDGGSTDLVVMDDFLYSEPLAASVPEPSTPMLMLGGALLACLLKRKQQAK